MRHYVDINTLRSIYFIMRYPYLAYCSIVWGSNYSTRLKSVHKIHKKKIRLMTFSKYRQSTKPLFKQLRTLDIFKLNAFWLVSLCTHKEQMDYQKHFTITFHKIEIYTIITQDLLHMDYHRTNHGKFSSKAIGTKIWNDLPDKVKNSDSYYIFKRKMKLVLLNYQLLDCLNFIYIK